MSVQLRLLYMQFVNFSCKNKGKQTEAVKHFADNTDLKSEKCMAVYCIFCSLHL